MREYSSVKIITTVKIKATIKNKRLKKKSNLVYKNAYRLHFLERAPF